jgi:hypothetical protein
VECRSEGVKISRRCWPDDSEVSSRAIVGQIGRGDDSESNQTSNSRTLQKITENCILRQGRSVNVRRDNNVRKQWHKPGTFPETGVAATRGDAQSGRHGTVRGTLLQGVSLRIKDAYQVYNSGCRGADANAETRALICPRTEKVYCFQSLFPAYHSQWLPRCNYRNEAC